MYEYLKELGWEDRGRTGAIEQFREFAMTSEWGMPFRLRIDLQYAAEGIWADIFYYPKHLKGDGERREELRFSGVIFSKEEIPVLMKQLQITI